MKSVSWFGWMLGIVALVAAASFGFPAVSDASVITFNFTSDHCTGGCLTGQTSGATLTLTDAAGGGVDVNLALLNGNKIVNTGFAASFGWDLMGPPTDNPTIAVTNIGATSPGTFSLASTTAGSLQMDGLGSFEYGMLYSLQGGGSGTAGPLTFHINAVGGGLTTASFLDPNANGQLFGLDIISGTTGFTGAIDASPGTPVPEPGTLLLLGSGLVGLGTFGWRWHRG